MLITHEDEVAAHAKRIVRMRDGEIISDTRQAGCATARRGCRHNSPVRQPRRSHGRRSP